MNIGGTSFQGFGFEGTGVGDGEYNNSCSSDWRAEDLGSRTIPCANSSAFWKNQATHTGCNALNIGFAKVGLLDLINS